MENYEFKNTDHLADYLIEVIDELHNPVANKDSIIQQLEEIMKRDNIRFVNQAVRVAVRIVKKEI